TQCPGTLDIGRMEAEAQKWASGGYNPKPAPAPAPAPKITYRRIDKRVWLTNKQPTQLWNLGFTKFPDAVSEKTFNKGEPIEIVGIADHPLGSQYLMTASSFGEADKTGKPAFNRGFNKNDMVQAPDPAPKPIPQPEPVPTPTPTPTPVPEVPKPTEYDKAQDKEITVIKGTLNSIIALLREFAENI